MLQLDRRNGDLTVVEKVAIPGVTKPGGSTPMAVSPDRRFLYAATRGEPKIVAGFAIDQTSGKLKHVASGPLADSMPRQRMRCRHSDRAGIQTKRIRRRKTGRCRDAANFAR